MTSGTGGTLKVNGKTIAVGAWSLTRTPEQAFRDDIRRDPLDATQRLVFADWLDEQGKPVEAALERVLAEPDCDRHRLHYADACERAGQRERAEFVRVQVEYARETAGWKPENLQCLDMYLDPDSREDQKWKHKVWGLQSREQALYQASHHRDALLIRFWAGEPMRDWGHDLHHPATHHGDPLTTHRVVWERGFVAQVVCPAADWLTHADAILAAHPVRRVALTTVPEWEELWGDPSDGAYLSTIAKLIAAGELVNSDSVSRAMLHERWPGVAFTLPLAGAIHPPTADLAIVTYLQGSADGVTWVDFEHGARVPDGWQSRTVTLPYPGAPWPV